MQLRFSGPALVALGLVLAVPAHADMSARARLDNFTYTLVDLRPDDGIAPALTMKGGYSAVSGTVYEPAKPFDLIDSESQADTFNVFKPMGVSLAIPSANASARMSGRLAIGGDFDIVTRGFVRSDAGETKLKAFSASAVPIAQGYGDYEVTPFTRVIFSGVMTLGVDRTVPNSEGFLSIVRASMRINYMNAPGSQLTHDYLMELGGGPGMHRSVTRRQTFIYENATSESTGAFMEIGLASSGQIVRVPALGQAAPVSPVPEPAGAALMLCGLGVVAGVARRRERRRGRPAHR